MISAAAASSSDGGNGTSVGEPSSVGGGVVGLDPSRPPGARERARVCPRTMGHDRVRPGRRVPRCQPRVNWLVHAHQRRNIGVELSPIDIFDGMTSCRHNLQLIDFGTVRGLRKKSGPGARVGC